MGCSSQKNIEVEDIGKSSKENKEFSQKNTESKKNKNEEQENSEISGEKNDLKKENSKSKESDDEEIEMNDENKDKIEMLKKKHMIHEYYFYPTKNIPKRKFVKRDIDKELPSDFANRESSKNKDRQYFCFIKNEDKDKNKKKKNFIDEAEKEEETENNNLLEDDLYLFNQKKKKIKSIKPLNREEVIKPYNYQIEYDVNGERIMDIRNKENNKYEYLDMFPNGEAYKFINNEEEEVNLKEKEEEKKIVIEAKKELEDKKIEMIKKNDVNDIANIINKELKENGLLEGDKKVEENPNDF